MVECRKCIYFPCMNKNCDIYYGECEKGVSCVVKEISEIDKSKED